MSMAIGHFSLACLCAVSTKRLTIQKVGVMNKGEHLRGSTRNSPTSGGGPQFPFPGVFQLFQWLPRSEELITNISLCTL